jgi:hypothetical protein
MDANDVCQMARQLQWMEENFLTARSALPSKELLAGQAVCRLASDYWRVLRECL